MRSTIIEVRVKPRSKQERIALTGQGIEIRVNTPPVDGRANERVLKMLAEKLDVPKSAMKILTGVSARTKRIAVEGLIESEVRRRLREE